MMTTALDSGWEDLGVNPFLTMKPVADFEPLGHSQNNQPYKLVTTEKLTQIILIFLG